MRGRAQFERVLNGDNYQIAPISHPTLRAYAQNVDGRPALLIQLSAAVGRDLDGTRGIRVVVTSPTQVGDRYLRFESEEIGLTMMFEGVADSLLSASEASTDESTALKLLLDSFEELKAMFARRTARLTEAGVRGLFAELLLLLEMRDAGYGPAVAVSSWKGPYRAAKDVVLPDGQCVEVKSIRRLNHRVVISNLDQLDPREENLRLAVVEIETAVEGRSQSLLELLGEVRDWVSEDPSACQVLDQALDEIGLDEQDIYYQQWRFEVGDWKWFQVTRNFPRIRAEDVPIELSAVSFKLDIDRLSDFVSTPFWAEES